jgi:tetratricopeptide (TPR) repeat protein
MGVGSLPFAGGCVAAHEQGIRLGPCVLAALGAGEFRLAGFLRLAGRVRVRVGLPAQLKAARFQLGVCLRVGATRHDVMRNGLLAGRGRIQADLLHNFGIFRVMPRFEEQDLPNSSAGTARRAYPETRFTVWAKSLGVVLVGIAGVILSFIGLHIQRSVADVQRSVAENQRRNSVDDLALKHQTFDHLTKTDDARLAASLITLLKCNDDLQRAAALELLSRAAPEHGDRFSALVLKHCSGLSSTVKVEVSRLQEQSKIQQQVNEFSVRLGNARDYKNHGHDGPAARLFNEASRLIPASDSRVNKEKLERAKKAFDEGRFDEAADLYVQAFRGIPDLP